MQRGPEIGPVRADFTRQECAPPRPPPRGGRPPCRLLEWSAASARHNTAGSAAVSTDHPGPGRARGGSHAPPRAALPPGRRGQGQAGEAEPVRGLTPGSSARSSPERSTRGGAFPVGFPNPFPPRGGARGQRPCRAPRIGSGSRPCPPAPGRNLLPCPPVPSTPQRGGGRTIAGEQAHLPEAAAKAGASTESASGPPRRLSAGAEGMERRGPDGRFPELLLRSSVSTAVPGKQRLNCHSPPPSAPAVSASSSHSFLPPPSPSRRAPSRPAPARRPRAVRHGVTPTGPPRSAIGGGRSLAHVFPAPALERLACNPGGPGRGLSARDLRGAGSRPSCPSGPQDFARSRLGYGAGVSSRDELGCFRGDGRCCTWEPWLWHFARHYVFIPFVFSRFTC